jgi:hypothetical protein
VIELNESEPQTARRDNRDRHGDRARKQPELGSRPFRGTQALVKRQQRADPESNARDVQEQRRAAHELRFRRAGMSAQRKRKSHAEQACKRQRARDAQGFCGKRK